MTSTDRVVRRERTVVAPARDIFDLLVHPARHTELAVGAAPTHR